jgi:ubiquinone/menaquinone biosynthesis C-methylase UbiE
MTTLDRSPRHTGLQRAVYDRYAAEYDSAYTSPLHRAEDLYVRDLLRRMIQRDHRVMDLGCGTALFLDLFPMAPDRYTGVDLSQKMLDVAGWKYPLHRERGSFSRTDMTATGAPDSAFDRVMCLYGGVSYTAPLRLVSELERILKAGGGFLLMFVGEGALMRPSTILQETEDLWTPMSSATLMSLFGDVFDAVQVVPFSGPVAATIAAHDQASVVDDLAWDIILQAESVSMLYDDTTPDTAYWQIVTGTKRGG